VRASIHFLVAGCLLAPLSSAETYDRPLADAVVYCVFPRNFTEAGTLRAVEEKLPDIAELGANTLWLMPIHPIGEKERKGSEGSPYAVRDFRAVHPALGTREDLAALADAAHARGIKVLLDLVPDHSAWDHPAVETHPDRYMRDDQGRPRPPVPAWADVVQFDYSVPAVRQEMSEVMRYWPRACGVDGYRVDVAGMVPGDFWREAIPVLRQAHTGIVMLAEAVGPDYHEQGFDLSYDMGLRDLLVQVARGERPASELGRHVEHVRDTYRAGALLLRYTENHDIDRAALAFGRRASRTAAAFVCSLPGVPLIYAGQEWGIAERPDLFEKDVVPWNEGDPGVRAFYRRLLELRREYEPLRRGSLAVLGASPASTVVAIRRTWGDETLAGIFNFGDVAVQARVDIDLGGAAGIRNLYDNHPVTWRSDEAQTTVDLPAWGFVLLREP
jgi:glycosidase